jgi:Platelet-activating factor acetylhydrolase, isoform II
MRGTRQEDRGETGTSPPRRRSARRARARRLGKVLVVGLLVVTVAMGTFLGVVTLRRLQPVELPKPTGPYAVGRLTYDWVDRGRADTLATVPTPSREISVWVWYPASRTTQGRATYAPGLWSHLHIDGPAGLFEGPMGNIHPSSFEAPPAAQGRFTVVVLEPGMGLAAPEFTTLAEGLASHGYVVAGVTPTDSANVTVVNRRLIAATSKGNPTNLGLHQGDAQKEADRLLATWVADARYARTKVGQLGAQHGVLANHVDNTRTTYVGHSFGGAAALQACHDDSSCAGAVDLDGTQFGDVVHTGLHSPMMIVGSENSCVTGTCTTSDPDEVEALSVARALSAASSGPKYCFDIVGTEHFDFTDFAAWYIAQPLRSLFPLGSIDGDRALTIQTAYVVAFLQDTVHDEVDPILTSPQSQYPEVRLLRCQD